MKDDDIAQVVAMWLWFVGILFVVSIIGLIVSLVEGISKFF